MILSFPGNGPYFLISFHAMKFFVEIFENTLNINVEHVEIRSSLPSPAQVFVTT